jgi:hypothetical protein
VQGEREDADEFSWVWKNELELMSQAGGMPRMGIAHRLIAGRLGACMPNARQAEA